MRLIRVCLALPLLVAACGSVSEQHLDGAVDSAALGDAGFDAGFDGASGSFCGDHTGAVFCQDFDTGTLVEQGWAVMTTPGASLTLIASSRSAPFALEARAPMSDGVNPNDARVTRSIDLPVTAQTTRLAFDV